MNLNCDFEPTKNQNSLNEIKRESREDRKEVGDDDDFISLECLDWFYNFLRVYSVVKHRNFYCLE